MKKIILLGRQAKRGIPSSTTENPDTKSEITQNTTEDTQIGQNSTYDDPFVRMCLGDAKTSLPTPQEIPQTEDFSPNEQQAHETKLDNCEDRGTVEENKELSNTRVSPTDRTEQMRTADASPEAEARLSQYLTQLEECVADIRWLFRDQKESCGLEERLKEGCEDIEEGVIEGMNAVNLEETGDLKLFLPKKDFTDKDKADAMKILFHSRKVRKYCNLFPNKELDDTVFSLIDDLARFQDRLHQKDPAKARAKRRLIYGIREIKKHMKLKKLKGIIVATDLEDIRTDGGLNDVVNEIVTLADAYHIPVIFSHRRYNLGKICRKGVPVSCVGIFNYDGSEKNFKRILELQDQGKQDYAEISRVLSSFLTADETNDVFKLGQVFPDQLPHYRTQMLRKYFLDVKAKKRQEIRQRQVQTLEDAYADFCKTYGFKAPSNGLTLSPEYDGEEDVKSEGHETIEDKMCDIVEKYGLVC